MVAMGWTSQPIIVPSGASTDPLLKPTGTPTIGGSTITSGLIYYTFDTGQGNYALLADCSPGHLMYPPNQYASTGVGGVGATNPTSNPAITTTVYGTGFLWPGSTADSGQAPGETSYIFDTDAIRDSQNLYTQATGAGLTIASWFVPVAASPNNSLVFGRTARGFESSPFGSLAILTTSENKPYVYYYTNGATDATALVSTAPLTNNVLHSVFGTFLNTSSGSATLTLTVDGVDMATATGVALADTLGIENSEGQIQMGGNWHVYANHNFNLLSGQAFAGGWWNRAMSSQERSALTTAPWRMFA